jgi:rare lipoprotein A
MASWYGHPYHGRRTSNGEVYDMDQLTAAHLSLPFDTWVRVTNSANGRFVDLRINDRGPFVKERIIDLSREGARRIGMIGPGTARVRVEVVGLPGKPYPASKRDALAAKPASAPEDEGLGPADLGSVPQSEASCPSGPYYAIQVGSFQELENAQRVRSRMSELYGPARLIAVTTGQGTLYRVFVGMFGDTASAAQMLERIARDRLEGFVARVDSRADWQCL